MMANTILYGFHQLKDVFSDRLSNVRAEDVAGAIQQSVEAHNDMINSVMGLFAERTTMASNRYKTPGNHRLQPLDENGRARPVKFFGHYETAYPIRDAGTAWGANYKSRAKLTVEDANRITGEMLKADAVWMRDQLLAALFAAATYTYEDPEVGDLTIQPLANGDTNLYLSNGATAAAADTHQLAFADAIADATDPIPTIVTELTEHPDNAGEVVILLPTALTTATKALSDFYRMPDSNVTPGANTDVVNGGPGVATPGPVVGYHDAGAWISEWKALPAGYGVAVTTGGEKPLRMREEPEAQLQGFHRAGERNDHPFWEEQWVRYAGFGAYNRVGAVVFRIGNGTYATPTGYAPPIA
jgi:hypothetical protein